MNRIQCELCDSVDVIKIDDNLFQCQHCGCKYTLDQAKSLIGTVVEVVKGNAELEQRLKNADAKLGFGEYQKAFKEYMLICEDYPTEHIVHARAISCRYKMLISGNAILNTSVLQELYGVYKKAMATAGNPNTQAEIKGTYNRFFEELSKSVEGKQGGRLDHIDLFRFAYSHYQKNGALPAELLGNVLWDTVASVVAAGLKTGKIAIWKENITSEDKYEGVLIPTHEKLPYSALETIAKMSPKLKDVLAIGYQNAIPYNLGSIRVGLIFDFEHTLDFDWVKADIPALNRLYVQVDFIMNDLVFASYWSRWHNNKLAFIYEKNDNVSDKFMRFLKQKKDKSYSLRHWNDWSLNCPFCGWEHISVSIFGRKCKYCGGSFNKY